MALAQELLERLGGLDGAGRASCAVRQAPAGVSPSGSRGPASELLDVGALGLERRAQDARPALDLAAQRLGDGAGLLVEAPHQHRRPGAGDRRAERAQLAGALGQLERAREQVRAALLVQAVLQAAREQIPVAAGEPERQQRRRGRR